MLRTRNMHFRMGVPIGADNKGTTQTRRQRPWVCAFIMLRTRNMHFRMGAFFCCRPQRQMPTTKALDDTRQVYWPTYMYPCQQRHDKGTTQARRQRPWVCAFVVLLSCLCCRPLRQMPTTKAHDGTRPIYIYVFDIYMYLIYIYVSLSPKARHRHDTGTTTKAVGVCVGHAQNEKYALPNGCVPLSWSLLVCLCCALRSIQL